jgi:hypothetical protein
VKRKSETGYAVAWLKDNKSCYAIPAEDYAQLKEAFVSGRAMYEGRGYEGDDLVLRLDLVESIQLRTPAGMAASQLANAAEETDKESLYRLGSSAGVQPPYS